MSSLNRKLKSNVPNPPDSEIKDPVSKTRKADSAGVPALDANDSINPFYGTLSLFQDVSPEHIKEALR